ncbi:MAG: IS30 family transposase, partial [Psychrilyobacter sp.]|uniref:IS30 family transposase n=1 Tax=Psychrilyobacter sp. TaxID=2586924 RepID=UPI003C71B19D
MLPRKAKTFNEATLENFKYTPSELLKTFTSDNGKGFSRFKELEEKLEIKTYFANPYHSWERGTNENTNGLL